MGFRRQALGRAEERGRPPLQKSCTLAEGWAWRAGEATPLLGSGSPGSVLVTTLTCCGTSGTNTLSFQTLEMENLSLDLALWDKWAQGLL